MSILGCFLSVTASAATVKDHVMALGAAQTLTLAQAGPARFADVMFPDAALADAWFAQHLLQHDLQYEAGDSDRYGRTLIWSDVEAAMLRDGIAVFYNQQPLEAGWGAAEAAARQAKRGIWAKADFVLTPENAAQHFSEFHVVEGVVTHVYRGKSATYLNFGEDWHTDFSVTIAGRNRKSFDDVLARIHEGTRVRVRGGIYEENGPMIKLTRPEHLEIL